MSYGSLANEHDGFVSSMGVSNRRTLVASFVLLGLPMLVVTLYLSALPQVGNAILAFNHFRELTSKLYSKAT
jgi:hypothetical protein